MDEKTFTITARVDGFRRAGRAWTVAPRTVSGSEFSAGQWEALKSESMLAVTENVTPDAPKPPATKPSANKK
ncbi:MAG: HI1506-related protein [Betaproteobacteria bacterium]|nr:HI1506-related protein [Betaproteobacteria bacterium]